MVNLASIMGMDVSNNNNTFKIAIEGTRGRVARVIKINYYDPFVLSELVATGMATKKEYRLAKRINFILNNQK